MPWEVRPARSKLGKIRRPTNGENSTPAHKERRKASRERASRDDRRNECELPRVFYISEIDVSNPDGYGKEFAPKAQELIKKHGGKVLAIGGTGGGPTQTRPITGFSGEPPKRVTIQGWELASPATPTFLCRFLASAEFRQYEQLSAACEWRTARCPVLCRLTRVE